MPYSCKAVLGSNPNLSATVLSQDIVPACGKTLCAGQRPFSGW